MSDVVRTIDSGIEEVIEFCCEEINDGMTVDIGSDLEFIEATQPGTYHYSVNIPWEVVPTDDGPADIAILTVHPTYYVANGFGLGDCDIGNPYGIYREWDSRWMGTCVPVTGGGATPCGAGPDVYNADNIALTWGRFSSIETAFKWDSLAQSASGSFTFTWDADNNSTSSTLHCAYDGWAEVEIMVEMKIAYPGVWCDLWPPIGATAVPRFDNQWIEFQLRDSDDNVLLPHCRVHWADTDSVNNIDTLGDPDPWSSEIEYATAIITGAVQVTDGLVLKLVGQVNVDTGLVINMAHSVTGSIERHKWMTRRTTPPEVTCRLIVTDQVGAELYEWDRWTGSGYKGDAVMGGEIELNEGEQVRVMILHDAGSGPTFQVTRPAHLDLALWHTQVDQTQECNI